MSENIAVVIVTYNRKELILENLKKVFDQKRKIDRIIIIDNHGNDNTEEYLIKNDIDFSIINYVYLDENIGGAGGFYTGVKIAYEEEYDWIILMDDDGRPYDNTTFENLLKKAEELNLKCTDKVMINSLVIENENNLSFALKGEKNIDKLKKKIEGGMVIGEINPFNGTLISKGLVKEIGYPNNDFFIKGDEIDYTKRAIKANAFVATIVDSLYYHPSIKGIKECNIGNKDYNIYIESPWKEYYSVRNYVYMLTKEKNNKGILKLLIKKFIYISICKCKKISTFKMVLKGYKDGRKGVLGANVKP